MFRCLSTSVAVALVLSIGLANSPRAQQAGDTRQLVPLTASSLLLRPEAYLGETVSLTAAVERMLSKSAFAVDQDRTKSTGDDLLVLAPTLTAAVEPDSYVTVVGEVVRFDPDELARRLANYTVDLPGDLLEKYRGRVAVLATAVLNTAFEDLAKVPPPPPTDEEIAFDKVMKQVGPAAAALRAAINDTNAADAREQAVLLQAAFAEAAAFFKKRQTDDAVGWAQEAATFAGWVEQNAAMGNWQAATDASASLNQMCQTCHGAHRVRLDDGTYRVKWDR